MILSFRHKGLRKFLESGCAAGVQPHHAKRLRMLLAALDTAKSIVLLPHGCGTLPGTADPAPDAPEGRRLEIVKTVSHSPYPGKSTVEPVDLQLRP